MKSPCQKCGSNFDVISDVCCKCKWHTREDRPATDDELDVVGDELEVAAFHLQTAIDAPPTPQQLRTDAQYDQVVAHLRDHPEEIQAVAESMGIEEEDLRDWVRGQTEDDL